ncbi:MAG: hypothetical protein ABW046_14115 [Actinoplanes sp.]
MTDSTGTPTGWVGNIERAEAALADPARLFDQAQVRFLMAAAEAYGYEKRRREEQEPAALSYWGGHADGYRQRVAEENAAYPPPPYGGLTASMREETRRIYRKRSGADVIGPRPGDFVGQGDDAVTRLREAEQAWVN